MHSLPTMLPVHSLTVRSHRGEHTMRVSLWGMMGVRQGTKARSLCARGNPRPSLVVSGATL